MTVFPVFQQCVEAIRNNVLIQRVSASDKEFHFQNWFEDRLNATGFKFDRNGRNSYPDFTMVASTEGHELKGLQYPGRVANLDSNSQVPTGLHNGRTIYYVFGRYPKKPHGNQYPVLDLVVCHGDFLNADHDYEHENKNVKGFGSYGDIMIRDRKMYVMPTPFYLVDGVAHHRTLILPAEIQAPAGFIRVGNLVRKEAADLLVGYTADLTKNTLQPRTVPNPHAGLKHHFVAWRLDGDPNNSVSMSRKPASVELAEAEAGEEDE